MYSGDSGYARRSRGCTAEILPCTEDVRFLAGPGKAHAVPVNVKSDKPFRVPNRPRDFHKICRCNACMSPALNSNVTDKIIKEVKAWQNRQHGRFGLHQSTAGGAYLNGM